jgi:hypothetical protein
MATSLLPQSQIQAAVGVVVEGHPARLAVEPAGYGGGAATSTWGTFQPERLITGVVPLRSAES